MYDISRTGSNGRAAASIISGLDDSQAARHGIAVTSVAAAAAAAFSVVYVANIATDIVKATTVPRQRRVRKRHCALTNRSLVNSISL